VRIVVMRGTIHLVTADDALASPGLVQPVLDADLRRHRDYAPIIEAVDFDKLLPVARTILAEPHTTPQLRAALAERFPEYDAAALAFACRNRLAGALPARVRQRPPLARRPVPLRRRRRSQAPLWDE
jgi:hypothetical protein